MVVRKRLLADRQRPLEQRLRIGVALLPLVKGRQIAQAGADLSTFEAKHLFHDRQRSPVKWLGLGVAPLAAVSDAATSRLEGPYACSRFASRRCARGIASEYFPTRLSSAIPALSAATSFFCADAGVPKPALRTSASHATETNRKADRLPRFMMRAPHAALRPPPMRRSPRE
jgi:hypothetical protein